MTKTIQRFRPVLSLAIYHNPEEFFETKPLLEQIVKGLNYTFKIQKHSTYPLNINETALFAYPQELD
ncbi:hypothetical protein RsTz2092_13270 [Deferribacterales bacterium RsTz2092]|nr:hypothetical protein AGMMS49941_12340 [Deferribacterales bacterium]